MLRKLKQKKSPPRKDEKLGPKHKKVKERKGKSMKNQEAKEDSLKDEEDILRVKFKITADPPIKLPPPSVRSFFKFSLRLQRIASTSALYVSGALLVVKDLVATEVNMTRSVTARRAKERK